MLNIKRLPIMLVLVVLASMTLTAAALAEPVGQAPGAALFTDVNPQHEKFSYINYLANKNIIGGFPDGTYQPAEGLTRAQAAALLARVAGLEDVGAPPAFSDVAQDHWAAPAIAATERAGLLSGYPDGTFRPQTTLSRVEGMALLMRLSGRQDTSVSLPPLQDLSPGHWAATPVANALASGMVKLADGSNQFRPGQPLTRGDLARALAVLLTKEPELYRTEMSGTLKALKGSPSLARGGKSVPVAGGVEVRPGDIIKTAANSTAELLFPDGTGFLMEGGTEFEIKEMAGRQYIGPGGKPAASLDWLRIDLKSGGVFCVLASRHDGSGVMTAGAASFPLVASTESISGGGDPGWLRDMLQAGGRVAANDNTDLPWYQASQNKKARVQVDMPWSVCAVRGSQCYISLNRVFTLLADVMVSAGGKTVNLFDGQVADTPRGGAPSDPSELSDAERNAWLMQEVISWILEREREINENLEADPDREIQPRETLDRFMEMLDRMDAVLQNEAFSQALDELRQEYRNALENDGPGDFLNAFNRAYSNFTGQVQSTVAPVNPSGSGGGGGGGSGGQDPPGPSDPESFVPENWMGVSGLPYNFGAITYNHGKFIAAGAFGAIFTSGDAEDWTMCFFDGLLYSTLLDVAGAPDGRAVAIYSGGTILYSPDGDEGWSVINQVYGDTYINTVAYGGGDFNSFVAMGSDETGNIILTSPDGQEWTPNDNVSYSYEGDTVDLRNLFINKIIYDAGKFVALGTYSDDPISLVSDDLNNWQIYNISEDVGGFTGIAGNGNGTIVAVGMGVILVSDDGGISWAIKYSDDSFFNDVTYGDGVFVAVGYDSREKGMVMISDKSGGNWERGLNDVDILFDAVAYGDDIYVIAGSYGDYNILLSKPDTPVVFAPVADPDPDERPVYASGTGVELKCATPGARIYYTLDGGSPIDHNTGEITGLPYEGKIIIEADMGVEMPCVVQIKAIAEKDGMVSEIVVFNFTIDLT